MRTLVPPLCHMTDLGHGYPSPPCSWPVWLSWQLRIATGLKLCHSGKRQDKELTTVWSNSYMFLYFFFCSSLYNAAVVVFPTKLIRGVLKQIQQYMELIHQQVFFIISPNYFGLKTKQKVNFIQIMNCSLVRCRGAFAGFCSYYTNYQGAHQASWLVLG